MLSSKKQDYSVLQEFISNRVFDNRYTPDAAELEKYQFQLLFVCDQLQRGMSLYKDIEMGAYLCNAFTTKSFQFFKSRTGGWEYPIPLETDLAQPVVKYMPPPAQIKGELHLIEPWQFRKLDIDRKNGVQFSRKRIRILVPYRELHHILDTKNGELIPRLLEGWETQKIESPEKVYIIRAWMYVGELDFWSDIVDAGYHFEAVTNFEPRKEKWLKKRYYKFTRNEENI